MQKNILLLLIVLIILGCSHRRSITQNNLNNPEPETKYLKKGVTDEIDFIRNSIDKSFEVISYIHDSRPNWKDGPSILTLKIIPKKIGRFQFIFNSSNRKESKLVINVLKELSEVKECWIYKDDLQKSLNITLKSAFEIKSRGGGGRGQIKSDFYLDSINKLK